MRILLILDTSTDILLCKDRTVRGGRPGGKRMDASTWNVVIAFIVATVVETAIGTTVGLIIKHQWNKHQAEKQRLKELEAEKFANAEDKRCEAMKVTIHQEMSEMREGFKQDMVPLKQDVELMKKGMQKDIRRSLRQDGEVMIQKGYATQLEKTEFDELYWSYHNLGRNGVMDSLHEEVMKLPNTPKGE